MLGGKLDLKNLNRVAEPPKTGSQISKYYIQFQVEPTMFEPHLIFEPRLRLIKFGLFFREKYYQC